MSDLRTDRPGYNPMIGRLGYKILERGHLTDKGSWEDFPTSLKWVTSSTASSRLSASNYLVWQLKVEDEPYLVDYMRIVKD